MAVSVVWDQVGWGYRCSTTLPGVPVWTRVLVWPDGRTRTDVIGRGPVVWDGTVPLDGPEVTYYATVGGVEESVTVRPPVTEFPIVSVPSDGSYPAVGVVILSQREYEITGRPMVYDVLDRDLPWIEPEPPIEFTGSMVLRFTHPGGVFPGAALAGVRKLLRTGLPLMVRVPCTGRVETLSFVVESAREQHIGSGNEHGPDRDIAIDWRAVEPLWGDTAVVAKRIWRVVPTDIGTWNDAKQMSWDTLAFG